METGEKYTSQHIEYLLLYNNNCDSNVTRKITGGSDYHDHSNIILLQCVYKHTIWTYNTSVSREPRRFTDRKRIGTQWGLRYFTISNQILVKNLLVHE